MMQVFLTSHWSQFYVFGLCCWHAIINTVNCQSCLTSPPSVSHKVASVAEDTQWILGDDGGYHTAIEFDAKKFESSVTG